METAESHTIEVSLLTRGLVRRLLTASADVLDFVEHRNLLSSSFVVAAAPGRDPRRLLAALSAYVDR